MSYTVPAQFSVSINLLPTFCRPPASSAWQLPLGRRFLAEQQQSANNTRYVSEVLALSPFPSQYSTTLSLPLDLLTGTLRPYIQLPSWHPYLPNNSLRMWNIVTRISSMDRLRHQSSPNRSWTQCHAVSWDFSGDILALRDKVLVPGSKRRALRESMLSSFACSSRGEWTRGTQRRGGLHAYNIGQLSGVWIHAGVHVDMGRRQ